jgi:hypothetical protein
MVCRRPRIAGGAEAAVEAATEALTATGTTEDKAEHPVDAALATAGAPISRRKAVLGAMMVAGVLVGAAQAGVMKGVPPGVGVPLICTPAGVAAEIAAVNTAAWITDAAEMTTAPNVVAVMSLVSSCGQFLQALAVTMPSLV